MRRALMGAMLLGLLLAAGCRGEEAAPAPAAEPLVLREARELREALGRRREALVALCQLAGLAAPSAPDMALGMYRQGLQWGREALASPAGEVAGRLMELAGERPEAAALAEELGGLAGEAWPLGLVAEGAQVVSPALAEQALGLALAAARENPSPGRRQREMAGLAALAARLSPARGEQVAAQVGDPAIKAGLRLNLAALRHTPESRGAALEAARFLDEPQARALALARVGVLALSQDAQAGREILAQAMTAAREIASAQARALTQGEVAALVAQADPQQGLLLAAQVEAWPGARIKALRLAATQLIPSDPGRARSELEEAWRQARDLPLLGRRLRVQSLLVQDMALVDPRRGREMLGELPAESLAWRGEAQAALILSQAGRSLTHALEQARGLPAGEAKGLLLARLAGLAFKQEEGLGRAVLEEATALAASLPGDHLGQALAQAWAGLDPGRAIALAQGLADPVNRVKSLLATAKILAGREEAAGAGWALRLAETALAEAPFKEAIDKVRLLGHMGREWATVETARSRRYFQQGVETATRLDEPRQGSGS